MARMCVVLVILVSLAAGRTASAPVHGLPTPPPARRAAGEPWYASRAPGTHSERAGAAPPTSSRPAARGAWTALPPVGSRGIWIPFEGRIWKSAGWAESLDTATLIPSGSYAGFPVFRASDRHDILYVPVVRGGLLTPYRRTSESAEP